ncbi:MAG TPA: hypothetical protein VN709_11965 [Terriglobales bacterium]|nr:hypothetical protein [Terriglobales bacterium]
MLKTEFIGNAPAQQQLQRLVAEGRAQRTIVLSGPEGVGKTTLAVRLGLALNCQAPPAPGGFCGTCTSCSRVIELEAVPELIAAALEYREAEVKTQAREAAPLQVALHPAIRLYPPDGDFLTMAQARSVIRLSEMQPDAGARWTLIIPDFDRARWTTQAALLKTLEEPPAGTTIVVLARNPLALLPTVRSRALMINLAPVPLAELQLALQQAGHADAQLLAKLAQGCPGRALGLDLERYREMRAEAFSLLRGGLAQDALSVFRLSESTRTGKEKFETLLEILYSVIQDIVYLQSGFSDAVRNVDSMAELQKLAERLPPRWVPDAVERLDRASAAAGRNVFRPLALSSWALGLSSERSAE